MAEIPVLLDAPASAVPTVPPLSLSDIRQPVEGELKEFRRYFRKAMRSNVGILDKVTRYVLRQKGKEIRPILVLLSASSTTSSWTSVAVCSSSTSAAAR